MTSWSKQRGEGGLKNLIFVVVILYSLFCGLNIAFATIADKELMKEIETVLKYAGTHGPPWKPKDMKYNIWRKVQEMDLHQQGQGLKEPIEEDDIVVVEDGPNYRAKLEYDRAVELVVWTWRKNIKIDHTHQKY